MNYEESKRKLDQDHCNYAQGTRYSSLHSILDPCTMFQFALRADDFDDITGDTKRIKDLWTVTQENRYTTSKRMKSVVETVKFKTPSGEDQTFERLTILEGSGLGATVTYGLLNLTGYSIIPLESLRVEKDENKGTIKMNSVVSFSCHFDLEIRRTSFLTHVNIGGRVEGISLLLKPDDVLIRVILRGIEDDNLYTVIMKPHYGVTYDMIDYLGYPHPMDLDQTTFLDNRKIRTNGLLSAVNEVLDKFVKSLYK